MTTTYFVQTVKKMRLSQKEYFKFRTQSALRDAKHWETIIDQMIPIMERNENQPAAEQADLFPKAEQS